jgi:hypothetical protein
MATVLSGAVQCWRPAFAFCDASPAAEPVAAVLADCAPVCISEQADSAKTDRAATPIILSFMFPRCIREFSFMAQRPIEPAAVAHVAQTLS